MIRPSWAKPPSTLPTMQSVSNVASSPRSFGKASSRTPWSTSISRLAQLPGPGEVTQLGQVRALEVVSEAAQQVKSPLVHRSYKRPETQARLTLATVDYSKSSSNRNCKELGRQESYKMTHRQMEFGVLNASCDQKTSSKDCSRALRETSRLKSAIFRTSKSNKVR